MTEYLSRYNTFLTVAECRSVSLAAKRLSVSQPAVSAEISALETGLKTKLFFRTNRGVTLTPEGQVLFDYAKKGVAFIEAGEDKLREMGGLQYGKLRIGASDMTLMFFLLEHIVTFREQYPSINLSVTNAPTPKTLEALKSGLIDFGVVSEPFSAPDAEDFDFIPVKEIFDIFICHPGHPLSRMTGVSKKQLAAYPLNMLENTTSTRKYVASWLGAGFPEPTIELATSELLVRFAEQGLGVSCVVSDFATASLEEGKVVKINLCEEIPPRKFFVAYLHKLPLSAAARSMLDIIFTSVDRRLMKGGVQHV